MLKNSSSLSAMERYNEEMLHQKLYQIKMAISCWVQMNISFSSKFNLPPDWERGSREKLVVEARGWGVVVVNMNKGW